MLDKFALGLLSNSNIARLALGSLILVLANKYLITDYNLESSYDLLVITKDKEFIDDSNNSNSSRDCNNLYKPNVPTSNSSKEDSNELDNCSTSIDSNIIDLSANCLALD